MRQYRIKEERGSEHYPFVPEYSDDGIKWNAFYMMGRESYSNLQDAIDRIEKDVAEQKKQREFDAKTVYHSYTPKE